MNASGLANSSMSASALGRMGGMRAQPVSAVGEVSAVDDSLAASSDANHMPQTHNSLQLQHHSHQGYMYDKTADTVAKLEGEVATLSQDVAYFRHVVEFQTTKVEKLTLLLLDLLHNKDVQQIASLLQSLQASDPFTVENDSVDDSVENVHDVTQMPLQLPPVGVQVPVVNVPGVLLDSNMDPQLHQVAAAAVLAQTKDDDKKRKRPFSKVNGNLAARSAPQQNQQNHQSQQNHQNHQNHVGQSMGQSIGQNIQNVQNIGQNQLLRPLGPLLGKESMTMMPGLEVVNVDNMGGRKKPKVTIDFLHNPMTVKEIYDEFTRGFRGQPPLREMDERFGKHQWRGDLRSKESKRFQRRKKLCDAIEHGMEKYGKSGEEIISYIEEFRGDKSLTWVMNGNLPQDLID